MPKGQSPKVKAAICSIPIHTDDVVNILPGGTYSNGLIMVKLKKKLSYRGHFYFEQVCPEIALTDLEYLKENSHLYCNIETNTTQIPPELLSLQTEMEIEPEGHTNNVVQ